MLDDFHDGGGIVALQTLVAVDQRALDERDALALGRRQAIQAQLVLRELQRPVGHVHAQNVGELPVLQEQCQQAALAAAQVQDALRAAAFQGGQDRAQALLVQADLALNRLFFAVVPRFGRPASGSSSWVSCAKASRTSERRPLR